MLLYCISIFLKNENIDKFLQTCKNNSIGYTKIEVTDQTNEKGDGYQVNFNGIKVLVLPCNGFHKDKDFEIGITVDNKNEWNEFIRKVKNKFENEYGQFDDGTEYFIIKDKKLHGNFFFIYDGQRSQSEHLIMLECRMAKDDFDFYKCELETIIGNDITKKINVISGDEKYEINKLIIKSLEKELVIEV